MGIATTDPVICKVGLTLWLYKLREVKGKRRGFPYGKVVLGIILSLMVGRIVFLPMLFLLFMFILSVLVGIYYFYHRHLNRKLDIRAHIAEMLEQLQVNPTEGLEQASEFLGTHDYISFFGPHIHIPMDALQDISLEFDKSVTREIILKVYLQLLTNSQ